MTQEKTQACQDRAIQNATRDSLSRWEQEINLPFNLSPFCEVETEGVSMNPVIQMASQSQTNMKGYI